MEEIGNRENIATDSSVILDKISEKREVKKLKNGSFKNYKILAVILFFALISIVLFTSGLYIGLRSTQETKQNLIGRGLLPDKYKNADFNRLWEALNTLEGKYIGDVDYNKVIDGAIAGMVAGLEDPFTAYFNKQNLELFNGEITGTFEGIGAEVSARDKKLVIVAPLDGSPAQKAGLKPGDVIKMIDNYPVDGLTIDEAVMRMRGKKGTEVTLTISREEGKTQEIKVRRDVINVKSAEYKDLGDGIAYIRLLRFDGTTKTLFEQYADTILNNKSKGLVLDMRNNPGGYLDSAIDISSEFIKEGVVVMEENKAGERKETKATGKGKLFDIPLVVLVNGGSASASEIVAGAIKDYKRGVLIGEKTFGKGSVQEMIGLSTGEALKITVAHWLTPNGTAIDKNGLLPDIEVKWEENGDVAKDNQLDRAKEELKKQIK